MDSNILGWYNAEVCKNGFIKAEICEANKKEIQESSSDEEDDSKLENVSNKVLKHLESFKFYSNEDFDGFNV